MSFPRVRVLALAATLSFLLSAPSAWAHCDTLSGPVAQAVQAAFKAGDVRPVLKWIKADAEPDARAAFDKALAARQQGGAAREVAERYFLETVVRLHRAGEGAPFTGLKAEPEDPHGLIGASDLALEKGSPEPLKALEEKIAAGLRERYERVLNARKHADDSVEAGRRYVEAYVAYIHYVEALQNALGHGAHAEAAPAHRPDR
jgi:hypothetical protein